MKRESIEYLVGLTEWNEETTIISRGLTKSNEWRLIACNAALPAEPEDVVDNAGDAVPAMLSVWGWATVGFLIIVTGPEADAGVGPVATRRATAALNASVEQ